MTRPSNPETPEAGRTPSKRRRQNKAAQAVIQAVEDRAECVSQKIDELVEKLAPYPLQGG
jgi:hypothetical protein